MTQYARPDADVSNDGSWQNASAGSELYSSIDESSTDDTDYVTAQPSGGAETFVVTLSNVSDPSSAADHKVYYRASDDSGGDAELVITLKQGSTSIASSTNSSISASITAYNFTLSSTEANNISDYDDLKLSFAGDDPDSMGIALVITQAWFQCPDTGGGGGATAIPRGMNTYRQMREN